MTNETVKPAVKRCGKCKLEKPAAEFYISKNAPDGLQAYCKACQKVAQKKKTKKESAEQLFSCEKWELYNETKKYFSQNIDLAAYFKCAWAIGAPISTFAMATITERSEKDCKEIINAMAKAKLLYPCNKRFLLRPTAMLEDFFNITHKKEVDAFLLTTFNRLFPTLKKGIDANFMLWYAVKTSKYVICFKSGDEWGEEKEFEVITDLASYLDTFYSGDMLRKLFDAFSENLILVGVLLNICSVTETNAKKYTITDAIGTPAKNRTSPVANTHPEYNLYVQSDSIRGRLAYPTLHFFFSKTGLMQSQQLS